MKHARIVLIQSVQQFYCGDILSQIKDKAKGKRPAIIHQLGLYLGDDGLIRCRGRLQYAQLSNSTKFPVLIPKESLLPFRSVHSPALPDIRVTGSQPFQVTGIDYARPLYVRNANKEVAKVYVCLFTCAAIRAHLQVEEEFQNA